jgi:hypothetical protein
MKILVAITFIVFIFGCKDNAVEPIGPLPNEINGQFTNWNPANGDSLFWRVSIDSLEYLLAYTKISDDGRFTIALPIPPAAALYNYVKIEREDSIYFDMKDSIQFSDTSAKYIKLSLAHFERRISLGVQCGNTNDFDINSIPGDYQIYYYYFDKPTEVTGNWSVNLKGQMFPGYERNIITTYNNVKFNQGWNQVIIKLVSKVNDIRNYEITNENRVNTEWILVALGNEWVRLL